MDNLLVRLGQLISPIVNGFIGIMRSERGEVVIPFMDSVAEEQRPAVTSFITNSGATTEDVAGFKSFDEFLSGYKPKAQTADWTSTLGEEEKALVGIKGWKTPVDPIKGYKELEKLVGHEKIAMPKKDKDGNYDQADFERVMTQLGRPKDPKEYKTSTNFKLPEGIKIDPNLQADFNAKLHKAGFLPHQYALVMDELGLMLERGIKAEKEAKERDFNESTLNLRTKWGSAYDQKAKLANNVLATFSDKSKTAEIINKYGNNPEIIELLSNIGGSLSEESLVKVNMSGISLSPAEAKAQIAQIRSEHIKELMDENDPQHKYFVDKIDELTRVSLK